MEREQVQILQETIKQVRHALAGILSSMEMVIEEFDTLPLEVKAKFEGHWYETYLKALQDLNSLQPCFVQVPHKATPR